MEWSLILPLVIGVVLATPIAALIVQKTNNKKLRWAIAFATVILGILTLLTLFI